MKNWHQLVRAHLKSNRLRVADLDAIVAELAAHLEEVYENARSRGLDDEAAVTTTLREVDDWRVLASKIHRARQEHSMNYRTRSLWLPSLITLLGASLSLIMIQSLGIQPDLVWVRNAAVLIYWAWLATLPIFGALGAYLSQRTEGATPARLAAGLSPALVMLIVMCLILPCGLVMGGFDFFRLVAFGQALTTWVAIPGVALLAGAAPFLRQTRPPQKKAA